MRSICLCLAMLLYGCAPPCQTEECVWQRQNAAALFLQANRPITTPYYPMVVPQSSRFSTTCQTIGNTVFCN